MALTPLQQRFVDSWLSLERPTATEAYRLAGGKGAGHSAESAASRMLRNVEVQAALASAMKAREERTKITQDQVLRRIWAIATADPNDLVEVRRSCCRYCWGQGGGYQRTQVERDAAHAQWVKDLAEADADPDPKKKPPPLEFDEMGGVGYDARKPANPDCQWCFGDGVCQTIAKDTRHLSPAALALYAGARETKEGVEVKLHDQWAALLAAGKHVGLFPNKVEHSGPNGGPIPVDLTRLTDDQLDQLDALLDRATPADPPAGAGGAGPA